MATELKKLTKALKRVNAQFRTWGLRYTGDIDKEITLDPPGTYLLLEDTKDAGLYVGFSFDADGQLLDVGMGNEGVTTDE